MITTWAKFILFHPWRRRAAALLFLGWGWLTIYALPGYIIDETNIWHRLAWFTCIAALPLWALSWLLLRDFSRWVDGGGMRRLRRWHPGGS